MAIRGRSSRGGFNPLHLQQLRSPLAPNLTSNPCSHGTAHPQQQRSTMTLPPLHRLPVLRPSSQQTPNLVSHLPDNALRLPLGHPPTLPHPANLRRLFFLAHPPKLLWSAATGPSPSARPYPTGSRVPGPFERRQVKLAQCRAAAQDLAYEQQARADEDDALGSGARMEGNEARVVVLDAGVWEGSREEWRRL
jgi:hypothetical protein